MKLSLEALKERAEATASMDLLATISGGVANACHDVTPAEFGKMTKTEQDAFMANNVWNAIVNGWND